jgi:hypothetical protein
MYGQMLPQISHSLLEDLSLVYHLSQRKRMLRTNGLFIKKAYKGDSLLIKCWYSLLDHHSSLFGSAFFSCTKLVLIVIVLC